MLTLYLAVAVFIFLLVAVGSQVDGDNAEDAVAMAVVLGAMWPLLVAFGLLIFALWAVTRPFELATAAIAKRIRTYQEGM